MKKLLTFLLLIAAIESFSQDWPVRSQVMGKKAKGVPFAEIPAFKFISNKTLAKQGTYQQLQIDKGFARQLLDEQPDAIQLQLPVSGSKRITCDLVRFSLGNVKFTENNSENVLEGIKVPLTYRGIVQGENKKNNVMLTVNGEYISLLAVFSDKIMQVAQVDENDRSSYRLYNSTKIKFAPIAPINCGTQEKASGQSASGIDLTGGTSPAAIGDKCVNVFVDRFDSLYFNRSNNRQQTIDFVYELYNSCITGYYNDSINMQITTINIWTTTDPYRGDNRDNALADLATYWKDNFWGNICVGLDFGQAGRSGLADDIGRVKAVATNTCPAYDYSDGNSLSACCYNDLNYNVVVQNFPVGPNTTQQQVYLVMHEMGHLLGANHTKWCGWKLTSNPDTYGTIDSCGNIEGSCAQGPPPPAGGATLMSYCVTSNSNGNFVNYNNGFGPLPGAAIRNFINQSSCILDCIQCFGLNNLNSTPGDLANRDDPTKQRMKPPAGAAVQRNFLPNSFIQKN